MPYIDIAEPSSFEWDEEKALGNYAKHGISFDAAIEVFFDQARVEEQDVRKPYGEGRSNAIGVVDGVCLTVTFTVRGQAYRIISARRSSRKERRKYGYHP